MQGPGQRHWRPRTSQVIPGLSRVRHSPPLPAVPRRGLPQHLQLTDWPLRKWEQPTASQHSAHSSRTPEQSQMQRPQGSCSGRQQHPDVCGQVRLSRSKKPRLGNLCRDPSSRPQHSLPPGEGCLPPKTHFCSLHAQACSVRSCRQLYGSLHPQCSPMHPGAPGPALPPSGQALHPAGSGSVIPRMSCGAQGELRLAPTAPTRGGRAPAG